MSKDQALVRHMLAVEAAMRAWPAKLGQDQEKWGMSPAAPDFRL